MRDIEALRAQRKQLKAHNHTLFIQVSAILFEHDPMGINFEDNTDEYDPEVGTILPRLATCISEDDVLDIILDEFAQWFAPADLHSDHPRYRRAAHDIWLAYEALSPH